MRRRPNYLEHASPIVAAAFIAEIEAGIKRILDDPEMWRVVAEPGIRRHLVHRYPYAIYYQWRSDLDNVRIYAVMHLRREPGYWRERLR
jgi:toxin ParE1/3/4